VRLADWTVRALVTLTFLALLISPEKWGPRLSIISLAVVGTWTLLYPSGVLSWVKTAHPEIDADDPSLWWVPRLIGAFFLAIAVVIILVWRFR
jgi:hypothetical protein